MKYKILIGIVVVYVIIIGILLYIKEMNKIQLILYPDVAIEYDGKSWSKINFNQDKEYNIYLDNHFSSRGYIKDNDGEITINDKMVYNYLASNKEIKLIDFYEKEVDESEKNEILEMAKINSNFVTINSKIDIDYDKDGKIETLYFISNSYNSGNDDLFSLIYAKDEEGTFILNRKYPSEKDTRTCYLDSIVNINNSNKFIVKCPGFSESSVKVQIYELKNGKLTMVADIWEEL